MVKKNCKNGFTCEGSAVGFSTANSADEHMIHSRITFPNVLWLTNQWQNTRNLRIIVGEKIKIVNNLFLYHHAQCWKIDWHIYVGYKRDNVALCGWEKVAICTKMCRRILHIFCDNGTSNVHKWIKSNMEV